MPVRGVQFALVGALAVALACGNAGEDRVVAITATGRIEGVIYFDENGSGIPDGLDPGLPGFEVAIVAYGTVDTVANPVAGADGTFVTPALPVGRYVVRVPSVELGDSVVVVQLEDSVVGLLPDAVASVTVGIGYPAVSITEARGLALGSKVFVEGVALTALGVFGDTSTFLADLAMAIRATRVQRAVQLAGDSLRIRGTLALRDGQPVLDDVTPYVLAVNRPIPPASVVGTALAAVADGGRLDAALVRVSGASVADTATTSEGFVLAVDDGSGTLDILFDGDITFDLDGLVPGVSVDCTGILVPTEGGAWTLKPRSDTDVVLR